MSRASVVFQRALRYRRLTFAPLGQTRMVSFDDCRSRVLAFWVSRRGAKAEGIKLIDAVLSLSLFVRATRLLPRTVPFLALCNSYDQGYMSGMLSLSYFLDTFPQTRDANVGGITVACYELGCLLGAIGAIFFGDKMGRKTTIFLGMWIMIAGTIIMTCSFGLPEFIVGRGELFSLSAQPMSHAQISSLSKSDLGNRKRIQHGDRSSTAVGTRSTCDSRISRLDLGNPDRRRHRDRLLGVPRYLVGFVSKLSASEGHAQIFAPFPTSFVESSFSWRFPIAFQIFFALCTVILLFGVPESPAWLIKHGHKDEARVVLAKIYRLDPNDREIDGMMDAAEKTNAEVSAFRFRDLFTSGPSQNFRRGALAVVSQVFQQVRNRFASLVMRCSR